MATIEGSTAASTSPPLTSFARRASRSSDSSSGLTSTHSPSERLRVVSSLQSEKRVMRAASLRTQNSPRTSSVRDTPIPKRLHDVPSASKWWASTAPLRGIGRRHRLHVALPDTWRDGHAAHSVVLLGYQHRRLQRRRWVL